MANANPLTPALTPEALEAIRTRKPLMAKDRLDQDWEMGILLSVSERDRLVEGYRIAPTWRTDFENAPTDRKFAVCGLDRNLGADYSSLKTVRWNALSVDSDGYWWDGYEAHYRRDGKPPRYWTHWAELSALLPSAVAEPPQETT